MFEGFQHEAAPTSCFFTQPVGKVSTGQGHSSTKSTWRRKNKLNQRNMFGSTKICSNLFEPKPFLVQTNVFKPFWTNPFLLRRFLKVAVHGCVSTWEGGRRKVGMGRSVKDKFKSCLAVNSSCRKSFFHYSRRQSRGPHEDWDQIWYRLLGLLSEMWYQAWYQMWHRPLGAATRSVVQIWYWRYQIWLALRKQASPT